MYFIAIFGSPILNSPLEFRNQQINEAGSFLGHFLLYKQRDFEILEIRDYNFKMSVFV